MKERVQFYESRYFATSFFISVVYPLKASGKNGFIIQQDRNRTHNVAVRRVRMLALSVVHVIQCYHNFGLFCYVYAEPNVHNYGD